MRGDLRFGPLLINDSWIPPLIGSYHLNVMSLNISYEHYPILNLGPHVWLRNQ